MKTISLYESLRNMKQSLVFIIFQFIVCQHLYNIDILIPLCCFKNG